MCLTDFSFGDRVWPFIAQIVLEGRSKALTQCLCQMFPYRLRHLGSLCSFFDQNFFLKKNHLFLFG